MDDRRFEALLRFLAHATSRRAALAALLTALAIPTAAPAAENDRRRERESRGTPAGTGKRGGTADPAGERAEAKPAPCLPPGRFCQVPGCKRCCGKTSLPAGGGNRVCWCKGKGKPCAGKVECCSRRCAGGTCAGPIKGVGRRCNAGDTCPAGATCSRYAAGSGGPAGRWCLWPDGTDCVAPAQCAANACTGGVCGTVPPTCDPLCSRVAPDCCRGVCVNTRTDAAHCGTCGNACAAGRECRQGVCRVPFAYVATLGQTGTAGTGNDRFKSPTGLGVGVGRLFVADSSNHRVQVFALAANGVPAYERTIGETGVGGNSNGRFVSPHDVAVGGNRLFVADQSNARVQVFTLAADGTPTYERTLGSPGAGNLQFANPIGVAVDGDRLFVADELNQRVQVFVLAPDGTPAYERTIGETGVAGTDNERFDRPRGLAVGLGRLFVADHYNQRVQVFALAGGIPTYERTIGQTGVDGDGNDRFHYPVGVAVDGSRLFVADSFNQRVQVFALAGGIPTYERTIGQTDVAGDGNDRFDTPFDVAVDGAFLYVADTNNHRVQVFEK